MVEGLEFLFKFEPARIDPEGHSRSEGITLEAGSLLICNSLDDRLLARLIRAVLGLERPPIESVEILGSDLAGLPRRKFLRLRRRIGVLGGPLELEPTVSVQENIAIPCRLKKLSAKQISFRLDKITEALDLDEILDLHPDDLTFAERRLTLIAQSIAHEPELILLESPFIGLPERMRGGVAERLRHLAQTGAGVVIFNDDSGELDEIRTAMRETFQKALE